MGNIILAHNSDSDSDSITPDSLSIENRESITFNAEGATFYLYFQNSGDFDSDIENPVEVRNNSSVTIKVSASADDSIIYYTYSCSQCNIMPLEAPPKIIVGSVKIV